MDKPTYIGIDIGKRTNACSAPGRKVKSFTNTKAGVKSMLKFCTQIAAGQNLFFVMEATSIYSFFTAVTLVDQANVQVAIVPPVCILGFIKSGIRRTKTDNADALAIRNFAEVKQPNPWIAPPETIQFLQQLRLVLDGLIKTLVRQKALYKTLDFAPNKNMVALRAQERLIKETKANQKQLLAEIEALIQSDEELAVDSNLILSIDGVGEGTRTMLMALCYNQMKTLSQRKFVAHGGINPQDNQSGMFKGQTKMNKAGDPRIREMLYMVAVRMVQKDGIMHDYFIRHKEELHKPGKVILVSIMRKLLHLIQAVVKSGVPFDREKYLKAA